MKLQSFAEWLFSLLQAATAGCFAEAQVLQRMADFRSRTACSATHILRQIYSEEGERSCCSFGPWKRCT